MRALNSVRPPASTFTPAWPWCCSSSQAWPGWAGPSLQSTTRRGCVANSAAPAAPHRSGTVRLRAPGRCQPANSAAGRRSTTTTSRGVRSSSLASSCGSMWSPPLSICCSQAVASEVAAPLAGWLVPSATAAMMTTSIAVMATICLPRSLCSSFMRRSASPSSVRPWWRRRTRRARCRSVPARRSCR